MADSESILQLGIEAARAGDKARARELFRLVTREDPGNAQGWLWRAGVAEDREEKRQALERVVQIDPGNDLARKGLLALQGSRGGATRQAAATGPAPASAPAAVIATEPTGPMPEQATPGDEPTGAISAADDLDVYDPVYDDVRTDPISRRGARTYALPVASSAAAGAPTYSEDYDLSDYQDAPRGMADEDDQGGMLLVDDEPPRRKSPAWLMPLMGLLGAIVIGALLFTQCNPGSSVVTQPTRTVGRGGTSVALGVTTTAMATTPDAAETSAPTTAVDVLTAGPVLGDTTAPLETTTIVIEAAPGGTMPPAEESPIPTPGQTEIVIEPGTDVTEQATDQAPVASPEQTIIVIEPGTDATPTAPPDQTAVAVAETPAPPIETAPPPPPPPVTDVAGANPAIVPPQQAIVAGTWDYVWDYGYGPLLRVGTGSYGGSQPVRGQWLAVTLAVANTSGQAQLIPDGFFVLKDGQNRVYDFNRAASAEWVARFGRGVVADTSADTPIGTTSESVVLLFDVPPEATNLVLFSRENVGQGYLVR